MIFDKEFECMDREEIRKVQGERLRKTVERVYKNVPFYREAFKEKGIEPGDIKTVDDISKLPFTTKQDLRDNYPFGLFTLPMSEIVRLHASSGTTGKPTVVGYSQEDIVNWSNLIARCLVMAGGSKEDVVQVAYGYGLFTGGMGIHYGVERLGATVIPISGGNTNRQLMLMEDFGTSILCCTPSYALFLADEIREAGIRDNLKLKSGIFGAEPWSSSMRKELETKLQIDAYDIYGLSEVMGPGVAMECKNKNGMHIFEDYFIPEIIDPETGETLPYGQKGELVFTTIMKEALPVIRYRTKDVCVLHAEPCSCGRTHIRMEKITGRTDDMLIIRGVNVFPSQIESVLLEIGETEPHYQLVVSRNGTLDELEVMVEVSDKMFSDEVKRLEELEKKLRHEIASILGISAKIRLVEPRTLPRSEGKAQRVIDKRNL